MPLEYGAKPGSPGFSRNVAAEVAAGKPQKQAVAIAYSASEHGKPRDTTDEHVGFEAVEKKAAREYGSEEAGKRVAAAVGFAKYGKEGMERKAHARDADDPDIAPAVAETETRALNRQPERPDAATPPPAVSTYEDPGFRNPTLDSAAGRQVGLSNRDANAAARRLWGGRR